jgi:hypothetical protein
VLSKISPSLTGCTPSAELDMTKSKRPSGVIVDPQND